MEKLNNIKYENVFKYFSEICKIPRGSGNMEEISAYCMNFAEKHGLKAVRDDAKNVIIYKKGSKGYESSEPVILQGHLDMVCQKTEESDIDFLKDGISVLADGDFLRAENTTLGADNGIAVSMILAILASDDIMHPPIEAVFTTDEEVGMLGAMELDFSLLSAKKMINIDSEEQDVLTVSCAGGSEFVFSMSKNTVKASGTFVKLAVRGLKGGHSGVEIKCGRVNADILMGRILNHIKQKCDFDIISISGGDKSNAIPPFCSAFVLVNNADDFVNEAEKYINVIKKEIAEREPDFSCEVMKCGDGEVDVLDKRTWDELIYTLVCVPNGVIEMSAAIENLVETSLNLGILMEENDRIIFNFALRSNKKSSLMFLEEKLKSFFSNKNGEIKTFGHYPPWEYKENSELQRIYKEKYKEKFGFLPKVEAIHAGLECGVFASNIEGCDCISVGPDMKDVHTVNERLSIKSTEKIFEIILDVLKDCK